MPTNTHNNQYILVHEIQIPYSEYLIRKDKHSWVGLRLGYAVEESADAGWEGINS